MSTNTNVDHIHQLESKLYSLIVKTNMDYLDSLRPYEIEDMKRSFYAGLLEEILELNQATQEKVLGECVDVYVYCTIIGYIEKVRPHSSIYLYRCNTEIEADAEDYLDNLLDEATLLAQKLKRNFRQGDELAVGEYNLAAILDNLLSVVYLTFRQDGYQKMIEAGLDKMQRRINEGTLFNKGIDT